MVDVLDLPREEPETRSWFVLVLCRTHNTTFPRQDPGRPCWGHLEKLEALKSSTDVCVPYWAVVSWDVPFETNVDEATAASRGAEEPLT